jgi:hypothetical protein
MKVSFAAVTGLTTVLLLCVGALFRSPDLNAQQTSPMAQRPDKLIDASARVMGADDEASVRALADEIFNYPHVLGRMPASVEDIVKGRLVRSEIGFLRGKRSGVHEEDVVALFDAMAARFTLPEYVRTSKKQVRALRMSLAVASPAFMGRGMADGKIDVGETVSSEMSVLQAAHLSAVLLDQKFLDPNFQVPPGQWDRESHDKEVQRIKERQELLKSPTAGEHHMIARSNPKRRELHEAILRSTTSLSVADSQDILETALRVLKVDR